MKKFYFLLVFLFSTLSIAAQDRLQDYIQHANRYARVDLPRYRQRLIKEYRMSHRDLDKCYRWCEKNWGYVGLALELSRVTGKDLEDVCEHYRKAGRRGWKRVMVDLGIEPGSRWYSPFYDRIHVHDRYWIDCYDRYKRHPKRYHKSHRRHKWHDRDRDYDDDDDDDDDDRYERDDDDDDDDEEDD